jgi:hypothetical protein
VKLLTTNTEEIGRVHAVVMTVFLIVACNRLEVTEAELLTLPPYKQLQHGIITDFSKCNEDWCRCCIVVDGYVKRCLVLVKCKFPLSERTAHGSTLMFCGLNHVVIFIIPDYNNTRLQHFRYSHLFGKFKGTLLIRVPQWELPCAIRLALSLNSHESLVKWMARDTVLLP